MRRSDRVRWFGSERSERTPLLEIPSLLKFEDGSVAKSSSDGSRGRAPRLRREMGFDDNLGRPVLDATTRITDEGRLSTGPPHVEAARGRQRSTTTSAEPLSDGADPATGPTDEADPTEARPADARPPATRRIQAGQERRRAEARQDLTSRLDGRRASAISRSVGARRIAMSRAAMASSKRSPSCRQPRSASR